MLIVTLAGIAAALARFAIAEHVTLPFHLPVWVAFIGLFLAGSSLLTLEVQSNAFSISLTEIPIVLCLLSMQRIPMLVAGTTGAMLALLFSRRRVPLKLAFNTVMILFEMAIASAIVDGVVRTPELTNWVTWLGLVLALTTASAVSGFAVNVVIVLAGDAASPGQVVRHVFLTVANSAVATTLTLLAVLSLERTLLAAAPLAFLAVVSILPLRRHERLQRRYDGLLLLHEFTAGLTGSTDLTSTLHNVLAETVRVLRAGDASIVLPRDGEPFRVSVAETGGRLPEVGDAVWRRLFDDGQPVRLPRGSDEHDAYLERHGLKDLMGVPLVHADDVIGALIVQDRLGEVSTFDADDLSIFATMGNQTTVTLENLRLIDRLRDESAEREHQALHDELTGLPNRAHLYANLAERLAIGPAAVVMLDLNRFKEINDTLGHHVGDEVLVRTAKRLRDAIPASAMVARLGGDEFAIVLGGVSRASDAIVKLAGVERAFAEPVVLEAMSLRVDASIGIAVAPEHGNDRATLLRHADVAMYAAKQRRGTTIRAYDPSQERSSKRSLEIVGALREAVEAETIDVAFQPKARMVSGAIIGAEALARWNDPVLGNVPPDEFIPLAEQAGLIDALTTVILRRALAACAGWRRRGHLLSVAVNFDSQTLLQAGFALRVFDALAAAGLPPSALTIEITERELVRELDAASTVIDTLRATGVALSIDDFGTGYSSLSYLSHLPVDEVKIDRAFVIDVATSPVHEAIIRAISDIADKLGATTVVEGIEDADSWRLIAGLGCTYAQGYYLARPMPDMAFVEWLDDRARLAVSAVAG